MCGELAVDPDLRKYVPFHRGLAKDPKHLRYFGFIARERRRRTEGESAAAESSWGLLSVALLSLAPAGPLSWMCALSAAALHTEQWGPTGSSNSVYQNA